MKNKNLFRSLLMSLVLLSAPAFADFYSPVGIAIFPPVQFPGQKYSVTGVRASAIFGRQRDMLGLDLGLVGNVTDQTFAGVGLAGIFNITKGKSLILPVQLAGVTNIAYGPMTVVGVQVAGITNVMTAASSVWGLQLALAANMVPHTDVYGVQVGLYNDAQSINGIQIGLINKTKNLTGIQIGLLNFYANGLFPVSPIINIGF